MYWLGKGRGYTQYMSDAGRYTLDEAIDICQCANIVGLEEAMLPV